MNQKSSSYVKPEIRMMIVTDNPVCLQGSNAVKDQMPLSFDNCTCDLVCSCMCDYPCICPSDCSCPSPCSCPCGSVSISTPSNDCMPGNSFDSNVSLQLNPDFRFRQENFGGFLYDAKNMATKVMNKTAFEIIELIYDETSMSDIICRLSRKYHLPEENIKADLIVFLGSLISGGILINKTATPYVIA